MKRELIYKIYQWRIGFLKPSIQVKEKLRLLQFLKDEGFDVEVEYVEDGKIYWACWKDYDDKDFLIEV